MPISPILFILYLYNICRLETEGAYTLSYADDFAITVTSNSAKINCKKLKGIALKLMSKAKEAAISFNIGKTELIHFYNRYTTIEEGLKLGDIEIKIFKAKAAFYLIRKLGNI